MGPLWGSHPITDGPQRPASAVTACTAPEAPAGASQRPRMFSTFRVCAGHFTNIFMGWLGEGVQHVVNTFPEMKNSIHCSLLLRFNSKRIEHVGQVFSARAEGGPQTKCDLRNQQFSTPGRMSGGCACTLDLCGHRGADCKPSLDFRSITIQVRVRDWDSACRGRKHEALPPIPFPSHRLGLEALASISQARWCMPAGSAWKQGGAEA